MSADPGPVSSLPAEVRAIIEERLGFGHFFVQPPASISLAHVPKEELTWEIYYGRLLDAAQTRRRETFESWNLFWMEQGQQSAEPLLSVKYDGVNDCLHVTRGVECYAWEAYDDGNNVILTREVRKWVRELVATLDLRAYSNLEHLRNDLGFRLFQAVIGTSRLPLTSLEAPLPGFTLGKLAYFPNWAGNCGPRQDLPIGRIGDWWYAPPLALEEAKILEIELRREQTTSLAGRFVEWWQFWGHPLSEIRTLVLRIFDEVALSPYTLFVARMLDFLEHRQRDGTLSIGAHADILCALLRRLARHLTAFDLVTFHHRGANYPDLLLLDAMLKELFTLAEKERNLFLNYDSSSRPRARWNRVRALRLGHFLRRRYEGHHVPEVPTSLGENSRVLPASIPHLSEEEILDPTRRTRQLFHDDPIDSHLSETTRASVLRVDFVSSAMVEELGTALFLDRPLGVFKHPTQPDQTILFSYLAFSRTVAERRLREMHQLGLLNDKSLSKAQRRLAALKVEGIPIPTRSIPPRPGVPSLEDALKVAPDFVLLRTTRRTVNDFLAQYELEPVKRRFPVDFLWNSNQVVIVSGTARARGPNVLMIYHPTLWLEFTFDPKAGHVVHRCHEYPAGGLQLVEVWEPKSKIKHDVQAENIRIGPRG